MKLRACRLLALLAAVSLAAVSVCCAPVGGATQRPAVLAPPVSPAGVMWDAFSAAESNDAERFRYLLADRFVHRSILPRGDRHDPVDIEDFERQNERLRKELEPHQPTVEALCERYMAHLRDAAETCFVEVGQPERLGPEFEDDQHRWVGPNTMTLVVRLHDRGPTPENKEPAKAREFRVLFVQNRQLWQIDGFAPDPLHAAFHR